MNNVIFSSHLRFGISGPLQPVPPIIQCQIPLVQVRTDPDRRWYGIEGRNVWHWHRHISTGRHIQITKQSRELNKTFK